VGKARTTAFVTGISIAGAASLALGFSASTSWAIHDAAPKIATVAGSANPDESPDSADAPSNSDKSANAAQSASPSPMPGSGSPTPKAAASPTAKVIPPVAVTNGARTGNKFALTFDADLSGYSLGRIYGGTMPEQYNEPVIDYLQQTGTPATIFVTGMWAQRYPLAMQRFAGSDLFEVGNHTWSHEAWTSDCYKLPYLTDPYAQSAQVSETNKVIAAYTGKNPRFFRFPGLCHNDSGVALVAGMGMVSVDTDISGSDAFAKNGYAVAQSIANQARPGSIIVLHLNGAPNAGTTAQVVANLVPMLQQAGLQPVTLSELLGG
jgi:peptidoglycan/xylan/chitin deacetylase (PgdA/CDA1 family)